jgi:predicted CxxxxCH...CXXCH cytochrome family protein
MRHKKWFFALVLTGFLLLPHLSSAAGLAVHPYECKTCHTAGLMQQGLGNPLANAICFQCHTAATSGADGAGNPTGTGSHYPAGDYPAPLDGLVEGYFAIGDASNNYNSGIAGGKQSSHNWAGSINNPEAGANSPSRTTREGAAFYSRYGATADTVSCTRCHDPHVSLYDEKYSYLANPKLLRLGSQDDKYTGYPNAPADQAAAAQYNLQKSNEMCEQCHASFVNTDSNNHGFLTHFTGAYDAAIAGKTLPDGSPAFKDAATIQADPDSEIKLLDLGGTDTLVCVSCHGTHFTDSDANTPDGAPADMLQGDGNMLRGDGEQFYNISALNAAGNPRSTSLCNTCHNLEGMGFHGNTVNQEPVGCLACHGGHNYNDGDPSYYMLLNGYGSIPADEAERAELWGGTVTGELDGVCETCHGNMEDNFPLLTVSGQKHNSATSFDNCTTCHGQHSDPGGFSQPKGCTGCHGYAPSLNTRGDLTEGGFAFSTDTSNRYNAATTIFKDESKTPHAAHANGGGTNYTYACNVCHGSGSGNTASVEHDGGTFQDVMNNAIGVLPNITLGTASPTNTNPLAPQYAYANPGTCSDLYCHSDGGLNNANNTRTFGAPNVAPTWKDTAGTIVGQVGECAACHGNASGDMASAAHTKHLDAGFNCNNCHVLTATSNTAVLPAAIGGVHVDGTLNVAFDTTIKGGNTVAHGDTPYSDAITMTCSAVYCHSSGNQNEPALDRGYKTIKWTDTGTLPADCTGCHDIPAGAKQTLAHTVHVLGATNATNVARDLACATCHDDTMDAGSNTTIANVVPHANGKVDINMSTALDSGDCSNISCHSDGNYGGSDHGATANPQYNTVAWTAATGSLLNACDKCHGDDPTNKSYPAYTDGNAGTADANSHNKHAGDNNISCEVCHLDTTSDGSSIVTNGDHVNQVINVTNTASLIYNSTDSSCNVAVCHGGGEPVWGATGSVACGSCHEANKNLADSHPEHYNALSVGDTAVASIGYNATTDGYVVQCGVCHTSVGGDTITHGGGWVDPGVRTAEVKFDGTISSGTTAPASKYNAGTTSYDDVAFKYTDATCTNLYCHGDFAGPSNGNNATATWGDAASAACGTCHDVDTTPGPTFMQGGKHKRHAQDIGLACSVCHGSTADNAATGILDKSVHANQVLNWEFSATYNAVSYFNSATYKNANSGTVAKANVGDSGQYGSCDLVYCHSNAQSSPPGDPITYAQPDWSGSANCGDCHKSGPTYSGLGVQASGSHQVHVDQASADAYLIDCYVCHNNAGSSTPSAHANFEVNVQWDNTDPSFTAASYNGSLIPGDAYGSCSSNYCHSNGQTGGAEVFTEPRWGTTIGDCVSCHDEAKANTGLSGAHQAHVYNVADGDFGKDISCEECHQTTAATYNTLNTPAAYGVHVDESPTLNVANFGTSKSSCAAVNCHSNGNYDGSKFTNNDPTAAWATGGYDCDSCHGDGAGNAYPIYNSGIVGSGNENSHDQHVVGNGNNCGECHSLTSTVGTAIDGSTPSAHVNNTVNVALLTGNWSNDASKTCSATYCHDTGTPQWGGVVNCGDCHAVDKTLPATHDIHFNSTTLTADRTRVGFNSVTADYVFQCGSCHNNEPHANGSVQVTFNTSVIGGSFNGGTDQCSSTYCHSDGDGGAGNVDPTWNSALTGLGTCTSCHDNNASVNGSTMASGKHTDHLNTAIIMPNLGCNVCHDATVSDDRTIKDKAQHVDNGKDVAVNDTYNSGVFAYNNGTKECSNVYCHSDGKVSPNTTDTVLWTDGPADCVFCHGGATASTGGAGETLSAPHTVHTNSATFNYDCETCHSATVSDSSTISDTSKHINVAIDVAVNSSTFGGTGTIGGNYAAESCSAIYCHGSASPTWSGSVTTGDCSACHGMSDPGVTGRDTAGNTSNTDPQVGAHVVHLTKSTYNITGAITCDQCHIDTVTAQAAEGSYDAKVAATGHIDSDLPAELTWGALADNAATLSPNYNATNGTCSTTYCHDGQYIKNGPTWANGTNPIPVWYNALYLDRDGDNVMTGDEDCNNCHGWPPNPANHPDNKDCQSCHFNTRSVADLAGGDYRYTSQPFFDETKHINGTLEIEGGENCTDCHGAGAYQDPNVNHPDHADHTDVYTYLAGKTISGGDYAGADWYDVSYNASGRLIVGCGQCHPDTQPTHPSGGAAEVVMDPADAPAYAGAKLQNAGPPNYTGGKCENVYCHSDGNGTFVASGNLPVWDGGSDNLTCASCHGNTPNSGAHNEHEVGIHYAELYDDDGVALMTDAAAPGVDPSAAHGNSTTSDPISCQVCHNDTVTADFNALQTMNGDAVGASGCSSCHTSGGVPDGKAGSSEISIAANTTAHLNGTKNVAILLSSLKSRAQLRDDIDTVNVGTYWNRTNGYKNSTTLSFDVALGAPSYNASVTKTCSTTACHNGIETPAWNSGSSGNCMACHTELPQ